MLLPRAAYPGLPGRQAPREGRGGEGVGEAAGEGEGEAVGDEDEAEGEGPGDKLLETDGEDV